MWIIGIICSAFFSGTETGFYRVNRVRLALDNRSGAGHLRRMLWLANNPMLVVATTLVGNNLSNYLVSLTTVLATQRILGEDSSAELVVAIFLTPVLFIYGELLPKHFFFQAPNRLVSAGGRLFLVFTVLFAPATAVLWGMARLLQGLVGQAPVKVRSTLARKELQQVLEEGHEMGILKPAQRRLAQNMFEAADWPVLRETIPVGRLPTVPLGATRREAIRLTERYQVPFALITEANGRRVVGYVRSIDLNDRPHEPIHSYRSLMTIPHQTSLLAALMELKNRQEVVARIISADQRTLGLVTARRLTELLLQSN